MKTLVTQLKADLEMANLREIDLREQLSRRKERASVDQEQVKQLQKKVDSLQKALKEQ